MTTRVRTVVLDAIFHQVRGWLYRQPRDRKLAIMQYCVFPVCTLPDLLVLREILEKELGMRQKVLTGTVEKIVEGIVLSGNGKHH